MFSYNVDDLKAVVERNTAKRRREMLEAENILREVTTMTMTMTMTYPAIVIAIAIITFDLKCSYYCYYSFY